MTDQENSGQSIISGFLSCVRAENLRMVETKRVYFSQVGRPGHGNHMD